MPQQHRLDLARLDAEPAHLHLLVGATEKLQNPIGAPAPQIPAPAHPAPRRTKRVRHTPLPSQPRTVQIAPRKTRSRYVKLPNYPSRHRPQTTIQYVDLRVPDRPTHRHRSMINAT